MMTQGRTLVYKRTHTGDPDEGGRFGIRNCMGRVRTWKFDSVIGIGGTGAEPRSKGISGKLTWVGIGAKFHTRPGWRGPVVTFTHFRLYDNAGKDLSRIAPTLARRFYGKNPARACTRFGKGEQVEIARILRKAENAKSSSGKPTQHLDDRCEKCRPRC